MQKTSTRILSVLLSVLMLLTLVPSALVSYAAEVSLNITDENGNDITEIQQLTEYKTLQLKYTTTGELPEGTTVKWESNLPLLADVDDNGKVTAYDSSKTAIIQLWLDENVRVLPLVGDKMFHTQIGVGNRLDGGRRRIKKYLWSFLRTAPVGQVRL